MTDRIEAVLLHTLEQAREALEDARREMDSRQRDVDNCKALLAHHRKLTVAEPMTEAFPAIPAVEAERLIRERVNAPAFHSARLAAWGNLIGQRVEVTYMDGRRHSGHLAEIDDDSISIEVDGTDGHGSMPLAHVVSIAPAPDPTATISDPQTMAEVTL